MDLNHNCGFVTLISTGQPNGPVGLRSCTNTNKTKPALDRKVTTEVDRTSALLLEAKQDLTDSPIDKISIKECADGQSSQSSQSMNTTAKSQLQIDIEDGNGKRASTWRKWQLMDCSFGIPLFSVDLNQEVCSRLETHSLCAGSRLVHKINLMCSLSNRIAKI